jgi:phage repressor protein C with HTH and peptisase S24 domain
MAPLLRHGDQLLVRRTTSARPGQVVVVTLPDGTLAVKRLARVEPDGRLWVLGDNPVGSTDSRAFGWLDPASVTAVALARLWPRPRLLG